MIKIYKNKLITLKKNQHGENIKAKGIQKLGIKYKSNTEEENKIDISRMGKERTRFGIKKWGTRLSNGILGFAIRQFL